MLVEDVYDRELRLAEECVRRHNNGVEGHHNHAV